MLFDRLNAPQSIPLATSENRSLQWILGTMVFLVTLVVCVNILFQVSLKEWQAGMVNRVTIQIPFASLYKEEIEKISTDSSINLQELKSFTKMDELIGFLMDFHGIHHVKWVNSRKLRQLHSDFNENVETIKELNPPIILDLEFLPDAIVSPDDIRNKVTKFATGVKVEPYSRWIETFQVLSKILVGVSLFFSIIIFMTVFFVIVLSSRSGVLQHEKIIKTLQLMGANFRFIAKEFQVHIFWLTFRSACWGSAFALGILMVSVILFQRFVEAPQIFKLTFYYQYAFVLASIPLLASILGMFISRGSVMRSLRKIK